MTFLSPMQKSSVEAEMRNLSAATASASEITKTLASFQKWGDLAAGAFRGRIAGVSYVVSADGRLKTEKESTQ